MSQSTSPTLDLGPARGVEDRTFREVTPRLVPFLSFCDLAAYLDRVDLGFAKLRVLRELNFSETVYGIGAGVLLLGSVLFEVPSNIILHRVGARVRIARVMLARAVISGRIVDRR